MTADEAAKIVKTWPAWKQNLLANSLKSTNARRRTERKREEHAKREAAVGIQYKGSYNANHSDRFPSADLERGG